MKSENREGVIDVVPQQLGFILNKSRIIRIYIHICKDSLIFMSHIHIRVVYPGVIEYSRLING